MHWKAWSSHSFTMGATMGGHQVQPAAVVAGRVTHMQSVLASRGTGAIGCLGVAYAGQSLGQELATELLVTGGVLDRGLLGFSGEGGNRKVC